MLSRLNAEVYRQGRDLTTIPLTMDSWFVSHSLRQRLHDLGCTKIMMAGKSQYTVPIDGKKQEAAQWKQALLLHDPPWGIDVPSCRVHAQRPTFGSLLVVFFPNSTPRSYYLMHLSQVSMRGAESWHIWKPQPLMACFWKILKSIFHIRAMQFPGHGLYTALLMKVLA
jgi:hypothetical protein